MQRHPCRECHMLDKDKNNPTCSRCKKRTQYVEELERRLDFSRCSDTGPVSLGAELPPLRTAGGLRILSN